MKIFDFNIHLPCRLESEVTQTISNESTMSAENLAYCFTRHEESFALLSNANFMLFNQQLFDGVITPFTDLLHQRFPAPLLTALVDFRRSDSIAYIERAVAQGVRSLKVHSYHQQIDESDYGAIARICNYAENHNLILCIDTSYGTTKMYAHDNLKLAAFIADTVKNTPIVLLHSGGIRIFEAMLLADSQSNIFLESSFSLSYLQGSSLEADMAFAYKKIGTDRVLYGSDFPYIPAEQSLKEHLDFFERHRFSDSQIEQILYTNAAAICAL
ncbi:MAG: amidohydrolase family protein [Sulfuricurvum sp.]|nr:amidohydrolase family protein [Sulfuricurvum sp.]